MELINRAAYRTALLCIFVTACGNPYTCRQTDASAVSAADEKSAQNSDAPAESATPVAAVKQSPAKSFQGNSAVQAVKGPTTTPWLETRENKIYTVDGRVFRGRGANFHDTRSCNACTWAPPNVDEVKRRVDVLVDEWGANFIRLLVESYDQSAGRTQYRSILEDEQYLRDLVEIVRYIGTKPDTYVLVSLWTEPTADENGWPTKKTIPVWERLAESMMDFPHVLFGVINEPHGNWSGDNDAKVWKAMNDVVAAIRGVEKKHNSPEHIIAVQGTRRYARYLGYYVNHPITAGGGKNIVYESHSYLRPHEFAENWIDPAEKLPVIIGEFGPADLGGGYKMTTEHTVKLMDEAEKRDIPWLAWTFHMRCDPNLLVDNSNGSCGYNMKLEPSPWGKVIKDRLTMPWKNN